MDFDTTLSLRRAPLVAPVDRVPQLVAGFEIIRHLGSGGMGAVFEARDVVLGRRVALKFVRADLDHTPEARQLLLREARAMARVSHRNVITLYEVGHDRDRTYLVMELAEAGTLREWLEQPRSWREIVDMFAALGYGLGAVHDQELVHGDVNPSNIFLARDGTPKLGDFGVVRAAGDDAFTSHGTILGTPAYMAPEQSEGAVIDARTDQFAFCVSLFEALVGSLPSEGACAELLPTAVRDSISRGISADPATRFASMHELLEHLVRTT